VSLFAELFNEMLMRDFGFSIYKSLNQAPEKPKKEEKKKEDKDKKDEKKDGEEPDKKRKKSEDDSKKVSRKQCGEKVKCLRGLVIMHLFPLSIWFQLHYPFKS